MVNFPEPIPDPETCRKSLENYRAGRYKTIEEIIKTLQPGEGLIPYAKEWEDKSEDDEN